MRRREPAQRPRQSPDHHTSDVSGCALSEVARLHDISHQPSLLFFGGGIRSAAVKLESLVRGQPELEADQIIGAAGGACGGTGDAMISVRSGLRIWCPGVTARAGCSWTPRRFLLRGRPVQSGRLHAGFRSQTRPISFSTCLFSKLVLDAPQQLDTLNIPTAMPRTISHAWCPRTLGNIGDPENG